MEGIRAFAAVALLGFILSLLVGFVGTSQDYSTVLAAGFHSVDVAVLPAAYGAARFLYYFAAFLMLVALPAKVAWKARLLATAAAGGLPIALLASQTVVFQPSVQSILPPLVLLVVAAHAGYFGGSLVARNSSWRVFALRLVLALTLLVLIAFCYRWAINFGWRDRAAESPLPFAGAYAAAVLLTTVLVFLLRSMRTLQRLLGVAIGLVFLLPLQSVIGADTPPTPDRYAVGTAAPESGPVPRIILLSIDTIRADRLSSINPAARPTPHLDRLASDSVLFLNAISAAPWTEPAMDSLMKGVAPYTETTHYLYQKAAVPTLAEYLAADGYYTKGIAGNPLLAPPSSIVSGFHSVDVFAPERLGGSAASAGLTERWPELFLRGGATQELTSSALRWIEAHADVRFFFWLHYYDPHRPYVPPLEFIPDVRLTSTLGFLERPSWSEVIPRHRRAEIQLLYDSEVAFVDDAVGKVLADLKRLSLYDESLIIVVGDHGEEFWEHGFTGHGQSMYQDQLRVPLLIKLPGSRTRRRVTSFVPVQAVLPTVLALCGIEAEPAMGWTRPLTPLLEPDTEDAYSEPIVSSASFYHDSMSSVILENKKYILNRHDGNEEFYDLASDPLERNSLAESNPDGLARARSVLSQHEATARSIRETYGLKEASAAVDKEAIERLRSLGYIQ